MMADQALYIAGERESRESFLSKKSALAGALLPRTLCRTFEQVIGLSDALLVFRLPAPGQPWHYSVTQPVPALDFFASPFIIASVQLRNQCGTAEGRGTDVVSEAYEGVVLMLMQGYEDAFFQRSLELLHIRH